MAGLLARAGGGDRAAFSALYRLSAPQLMPYAMRIVRASALAEDILQESFLAIWRDAAAFDRTRAAPLTWMAAIVRNKAVDYLRANRLHMHLADPYDESWLLRRDPGLEPCEALADAQCRLRIGAALTRLDAQPRRAIELAFFDDMSHGEVAVRMTVPLGTVKTWIRRGCRKLRPHMERTSG